MSASYLRCSHCRGFYELALSHCRYCGKDVPVLLPDGSEKVFVDRETCRAIQVAEYEQLPPEAHADCMKPNPQLLDRLCGCLHCGYEGGLFEAVEMRWMVNEQLWACPCTTCGGRGFTFDIHLAEPLWECECGHWYAPPGEDRRGSAAKCPKCGSSEASGWFDDEEEEGEFDEEEWSELGSEAVGAAPGEAGPPPREETLPWEDDDEEDGGVAYLPKPPEEEKLRDDIDFPHEKREVRADEEGGPPLKDDDIPW